MIKFHFYKPKWYEIITFIINFKTNSAYHHCSMEICGLKDCIFQSRIRTGLVKSKTHHRIPSLTIEMPFELNCLKGTLFVEHMNKLVGSKFDILAALLGFFGKKIQNDNKYLCSECLYQYFSEYLKREPKIKTNSSPKDIILMAFGNEIKEDAI